MDYQKLAQEILEKVGGKSNVNSLTHCATRLRFVLNDNGKANAEDIKAIKGVVGVANSGGQFQVIIGSDVAKVYQPIKDIVGAGENTQESTPQRPLDKVLAIISGIFTPILPVITAAGMIKAVLSLLVVFKVVTTEDQNYQILNFIGDAGFYFLPVFLGATAAKQFKTNQYLGMLMGAILLHPTFTTMVAAFKEGGDAISLFSIPFTATTYSSTVIPIILSVWFMSYVEKFADKISPKAIKFFSVPLIVALVTSVVTFSLLGPAGAIIGQWLGDFFKGLESFGGWVVPTIVGIFSPFLVMTGTHYGLVSIGINNRMTLGYDTVAQPGMLASNVSQGGAALAIAFKTKDPDKRALASSAGITAVFGITEPALYGVTLQNRAALIGTMVSGGIVGFFLGIFNARNFSGGSPGLLTLGSYIGDNTLKYFYTALIGLILAVVISFVITFILYKEDAQESAKEKETVNVTNDLAAPVSGKVIPLEQVKDETFASGMLGQGVAIEPTDNIIYSPIEGTVETIFETKHAIGLKSADGLELLIHIGMDTVNLKGDGFKQLIEVGQKVQIGTPLMEVDFAKIKAAGYEIVTPMVITNAPENLSLNVVSNEEAHHGDILVILNRGGK
ncbi:beta-glucoside-specific PTS transporter subunit IIABC [uncultured Enterococcus sp.]|uniref:beta-glucoside-specific PTS transporter subunit IIABC n=1 Tax=uncultured Enterococcus sp. TaxID=167972 RepID=UPI002626AA71|nr:beta-glucoside-specific PTS transporter subunit IIABC [uncultured Enterococcus sp.]